MANKERSYHWYIHHFHLTGYLPRYIGETHFRLKHYAGDVAYNVAGILEKNKDTLFIDLIQTMQTSRDNLVQGLFPPIDINSKKRPLTAATQFKVTPILPYIVTHPIDGIS